MRLLSFTPCPATEVRDMVSSLRLDVDARRRKVDEILATVRHQDEESTQVCSN